MTETSEARIHQRLDEIVQAMGDLAIQQAKTATTMESLTNALAKAEVSREVTCPHADYMRGLERRLKSAEGAVAVLKWGGGVLTVALLIPGLRWFAERLWSVVIGS